MVVAVDIRRNRAPAIPGRGLVALAGVASTRVPPSLLALLGIICIQIGAAMATKLFALTGPAGAVTLRLAFAAMVLIVVCRPKLRMSRMAWISAVAYGLVLAIMNLCFYQAIARIPLGVAVTIEFLGPLAVALVGSRRWVHLLWALLAAGGVALLTKGGGPIDWIGVAFVLAAGACWACYILLSGLLGRHTAGNSGLAVAMACAALLTIPVGIADAGGTLIRPAALLAGFAVALLSSVIPYSLELEALRRIPPRVFGVLMSLEPAVAAMAGLVVLGEQLRPTQWVAICCVVAASVGTSRTD